MHHLFVLIPIFAVVAHFSFTSSSNGVIEVDVDDGTGSMKHYKFTNMEDNVKIKVGNSEIEIRSPAGCDCDRDETPKTACRRRRRRKTTCDCDREEATTTTPPPDHSSALTSVQQGLRSPPTTNAESTYPSPSTLPSALSTPKERTQPPTSTKKPTTPPPVTILGTIQIEIKCVVVSPIHKIELTDKKKLSEELNSRFACWAAE